MKFIELKTLQKDVENRLKNAKILNYKLESRLILAYALNCSHLELKFFNNDISKLVMKKVLKITKKRAEHIPLQYIFKFVDFLNLKIYVNKNVLIPRFETELLADIVINHINKVKSAQNLKILDICCGSGVLGLAISRNTKSEVELCDISKKALKVCKYNAKLNNLNVKIFKSNMFKNVSNKYNIIVTNPPYIKNTDIALLSNEVKNEPYIALNGGESGLKYYEIIADNCKNNLKKHGELFMEFGINQENDIIKLLKNNFTDIQILKDYNNINRFIYAKLKD